MGNGVFSEVIRHICNIRIKTKAFLQDRGAFGSCVEHCAQIIENTPTKGPYGETQPLQKGSQFQDRIYNNHCCASEGLHSKWENVSSRHVNWNWIAVCFPFWQCLKKYCSVLCSNEKPVWVHGKTPPTEGVRVNFWTGATSSGARSWGVLRGTLETGQVAAMMLTQADRQLHELQDSRRGERRRGRKQRKRLVPLLTHALEEIRPCLNFTKCSTAWAPTFIHMGPRRCRGISWWATARGYGGLQRPEWSYRLPWPLNPFSLPQPEGPKIRQWRWSPHGPQHLAVIHHSQHQLWPLILWYGFQGMYTQEVAHAFMQVKVRVEKIQYLLSAFEPKTCTTDFVWLAVEGSTVLQGQMKNISMENFKHWCQRPLKGAWTG